MKELIEKIRNLEKQVTERETIIITRDNTLKAKEKDILQLRRQI